MPSLILTDEQALELVKQLPETQQEKLLHYLILQRWSRWADLSQYGQTQAREIARQHGRDWDTMTEEAREDFIDDLLHEDR